MASADARHRGRAALRRDSPRRELRRKARVHHREGELRVRAGDRIPAMGEADRAGVALTGKALDQHPLPRRRARTVRAALRRSRPRGRRHRAGRVD